MLEQTFRARDYDEALRKVKRVLGSDALILSTKHLGMGHGNPEESVELTVVAGVDALELKRNQPIATNHKKSQPLLARMVDQGVMESLAKRISRNTQHYKDTRNSWSTREALEQTLNADLQFSGPAGAERRVIAMVGPTGVGKTTTIAKLASHASLQQHRKVALVSIDNVRLGATEQLERYAQLIGVPMERAHNSESLGLALSKFHEEDLVLVDTAGRSPRDKRAMADTATCLHRAGESMDVHLCLPASASRRELQATIDHHAPLHPNQITVTKLDEAIQYGGLLNSPTLSDLPLAFFTTGQRVPEDIELATAARIASLLTGEELH